MADMTGRASGCNQHCGCPVPCPGGNSCRCPTGEAGAGIDHVTCQCGEHCGCNPCTCEKTSTAGTGRANCRCREGCRCTTCAA
ncbi:hypothetical protein MLD38_013622 [Melastoma candidum]|uniref:Uncharacterized protein n=1 Tax=Melastoma candidum TaxID=119954 RepID=A0ACB9R9J7_9MYRT|nr:hypothetical protein MLD38_013622 [Melastoma candidum]